MSVLYPSLLYHRITDVTKPLLDSLGIRALLLDVDNTLTTHNNPQPDENVMRWLRQMQQEGMGLVLVSNNKKARIRPFAEKLGLEYTYRACKPLSIGFRRTARRLKLMPKQTAVIGDQIFTDILGGNLFGATTILVEPMQPEDGMFFRLKRRLEVGILRRYRKKGGKHGGR